MATPTESYDYAARLTRKEAKNFYYTFALLPEQRRRGIYAVYAFSRRADDAVDAVEEAGRPEEEARRDLDWLRSFLGSEPPDDPLVPALRDTIERFEIPREPFDDLLLGMEMDLVKKRYETFEELHQYCYRAASVVGLICMRIFGLEERSGAVDESREPAIDLGIAMQLTNIIRDVAEDAARDRVYLPAEDLQRFDCPEADVFSSVASAPFRELMRFQVERAREYFERARRLFPMVLAKSRYCPVLLARFYSRILDRVERRGYDVLSRRPSLPKPTKMLLLGSAWLESRGILPSRF